ncbi:phospho-N-acetylmuramoyl-pentapeptide-transferase [Striga asiatica]|uniref:Phospho-N-acetylmuramoyl-pentapeptide-transferase n=1 Tax=Striga asiatica TaxID=4170 RepID=A0A5A7PJ36_STRAF|nr:phospho-N-acetylmuramoyl-pentapeptide-transferase [Striga asiatica]
MNIFKPQQTPASAAASASASSPSQHLLQQAFNSLQTHFYGFLDNLQSNPPLKSSLFAKVPNGNKPASNSLNASTVNSTPAAKNRAMPAEAIEERLAGVPVYALSNGSKEFILLSGANTGKNLGLFCFSEADANSLLDQMKSVDPSTGSDSQVVAVALSKVFQLKVDGVALRLMPEASQIRNALEEKKNAGDPNECFPGVPVFQSKSLILKSRNKQYRPAFFRKEDLEKSLSRASHDQRVLNPILRQGDIQDSSTSSWDDVVFVPPGFDVKTDPSLQP